VGYKGLTLRFPCAAAPRRHGDALGKTVLAYFHLLEKILGKHHAGMHGIEFAFGHVALLQ